MTIWHCNLKLGWFIKAESENGITYGFYCQKCNKQFFRKVKQ